MKDCLSRSDTLFLLFISKTLWFIMVWLIITRSLTVVVGNEWVWTPLYLSISCVFWLWWHWEETVVHGGVLTLTLRPGCEHSEQTSVSAAHPTAGWPVKVFYSGHLGTQTRQGVHQQCSYPRDSRTGMVAFIRLTKPNSKSSYTFLRQLDSEWLKLAINFILFLELSFPWLSICPCCSSENTISWLLLLTPWIIWKINIMMDGSSLLSIVIQVLFCQIDQVGSFQLSGLIGFQPILKQSLAAVWCNGCLYLSNWIIPWKQ